MSAASLAEKGKAAIESRNWNEAIAHLSAAIAQSKSPAWLLARSQAYMEAGDLDKALRDAEYAYCTAVERGNDKSRKQMTEAQHRRSVVYFRLGQHANADACAVWAMELAKGTALRIADKTADNINAEGFYHTPKLSEAKESDNKDWQREQFWRANINRYLEALPARDPARKITAKLMPLKPSLDDDKVFEKDSEEMDPDLEAAKVPVVKPALSTGPFRSAFYQTDNLCTATLFMKFDNKGDSEKVVVDMQPNLISITNVPRDPSVAYIIPHAAIDPAKSSYRVSGMKIELLLAKAQAGHKWPTFGREELTAPAISTTTDNISVTAGPTATQPPVYPTSSRNGPKDWDRIGSEEDNAEDGSVDDFFKKLYAGATPEQQRAMMKSFQESNGTTLSTDWNDVGNRTVETNPPEGVEAKKW